MENRLKKQIPSGMIFNEETQEFELEDEVKPLLTHLTERTYAEDQQGSTRENDDMSIFERNQRYADANNVLLPPQLNFRPGAAEAGTSQKWSGPGVEPLLPVGM